MDFVRKGPPGYFSTTETPEVWRHWSRLLMVHSKSGKLHQLRLVVEIPLFLRVLYIPGGAGVQPSTVFSGNLCEHFRGAFLSSLVFWVLYFQVWIIDCFIFLLFQNQKLEFFFNNDFKYQTGWSSPPLKQCLLCHFHIYFHSLLFSDWDWSDWSWTPSFSGTFHRLCAVECWQPTRGGFGKIHCRWVLSMGMGVIFYIFTILYYIYLHLPTLIP